MHSSEATTIHLTSPVYAPLPFTQQFCAETAILLFSFCCTSGMWVKTGATTTSAGQGSSGVTLSTILFWSKKQLHREGQE